MATLTITNERGGSAKPTEMLYVPPGRERQDDSFSSFLDGTGLNGPFIADLLSEMLAHEQCGAHLYRSVAGRTLNPVLKVKYEEFGQETTRHVEILEELVRSLGGEPAYVSPAARATEKAGMGLLESTFMLAGSVDVMTLELVMLDAVLLAEAKDHANWSGLASLVGEMPKGSVRDAFAGAVGEVEPEEDEHLEWAQSTRGKLVSLQAKSSGMAKAGKAAEKLVAKIKDWLS